MQPLSQSMSSSGIYTLFIALIIGGLTTFLGFVYAYIIRFKAGAWGPLLLFVSAITLFGGYLVKIYAWKTILGNEGIINSMLTGLHIVKEPVSFAALQSRHRLS